MTGYITGFAQGQGFTPPPFFKPLGQTGLWCHPLGFGCYRIEEDNPAHEAALRDYLARGGNLIDTSANYTDGGAERTIGRVLRDVDRASVIVVTKGGYIQGENMRLAQRRNFPEVVKYGPGLWHCIHPEFLATQIERSRERMGLATLDVFLLHNPEYFLNACKKRGVTAADHDEFYRRIREAFAFLETQVAAGTIRFYGISSNNFPLPADDPTQTSIARCLAQAEAVTPNHHFRVVQFPLNLFETGAATEANNEGLTPLAFCAAKGIGTLANRPLNAFTQQRMIRLADFAVQSELSSLESLAHALSPLRAHETTLTTDFGLTPPVGGLAGRLLQLAPQLDSVFVWEQNAYQLVILPVQEWLSQVKPPSHRQAAFAVWRDRFIELANEALTILADFAAAQSQRQSDSVQRRLAAAGYADDRRTLSQMAVNTLRSLPNLSCVLVGMRQTRYVADMFEVLALPMVDGEAILRSFAVG
ncbi:MAG: aldo/keto reductase [Chloracidobacterium sp.]|nr:aldo/keto reductase [Chloracidobacterium sp.]MDW8216067.1 aldo/keto reductase [Acidobacteriota bacterium]